MISQAAFSARLNMTGMMNCESFHAYFLYAIDFPPAGSVMESVRVPLTYLKIIFFDVSIHMEKAILTTSRKGSSEVAYSSRFDSHSL